jgi:hypothetical protein
MSLIYEINQCLKKGTVEDLKKYTLEQYNQVPDAIIIPCVNGKLAKVKYLVSIGMDINKSDKKGQSPLMHASGMYGYMKEQSYLDVVEYIASICDEKEVMHICKIAPSGSKVEGILTKRVKEIWSSNK